MEIRPTLPPIAAPSSPQVQQLVSGWRAGQVLDATVVDTPADNTVVLKVGNAVLLAKGAGLPDLANGAALKLEVLSSSGAITLKLLPPNVGQSSSPTTEPLRQWLPKQSPLAPLLSNLAALTTSPPNAAGPLPNAVAQAVRQFLATLPTVQQVTQAKNLPQAIADSGAFLEHKLRQALPDKSPLPTSSTPFKHDLKNALLQLSSALEQARGQTEAARPTAPTTRGAPTAATPVATAAPRGEQTETKATPAPPTLLRREESATTPLAAGKSDAAAPNETRAATGSALPPARTVTDLPAPLKGAPLLAQPRVAPDIAAAATMPTLLRDLRDQVEGAVARMTATQLTHTSSSETNPPWQITCELPLRRDQQHVDVLGLRIAEEGARERDPAKRRFNVTLSFDFPETGPFYAHIRLIDKLVSCSFQAEHPHTAARVTRELSRLATEFSRAGLNVGDLSAQQGTPNTTGRRPTMAPLLDTKA